MDEYATPQPLPPRRTGTPVNGWLVAILVVLVGLLIYQMVLSRPRPLHDPNAQPRAITARGDLAGDEQATIELFKAASPTVVHITSIAVGRQRGTSNVLEVPRGTGSGFIWDREGNVVTNFHVIQGAERATVTLADNTSYSARFVGAEPDKDLAVLKIDAPADQLVPIPVGASSDLQVGQKVFAIGNPFSLDQTLTTGIISGLGREIESVSGRPIEGVIQTDAAINPGNSGGPLLDSAGRLIGVNTAIYSRSGDYAGIGFAVPVDTVNRIVPELIQSGTIDRPGLGVSIVEDGLVEQLIDRGALDRRGVLVWSVLEGSPAEQAGIQATRRTEKGPVLGDLIVAVDGEEIENSEDLFRVLGRHQVGDSVEVTLYRDGEERTVSVKLQAIPR